MQRTVPDIGNIAREQRPSLAPVCAVIVQHLARALGRGCPCFVSPARYDVQDRKLLVNDDEAASVRRIFERFVELGSATVLARELRRDGLPQCTRWSSPSGM